MTLPEQLAELKANYASGILKIREGDDWVEYQTMGEMRIAIRDLEREVSNKAVYGTRFVQVSKGYN